MIKPRPKKSSGFSSSEVRRLNDTEPVYIRGPWKHYRCPFCDDKSAHLGINEENGAVRCLKCDFRSSVSSSGARRIMYPSRKVIGEDMFYWEENDPAVDKYMESRHIERGQYAYGTGKLQGFPVFPVYDSENKFVYLQYRIPNRGYRSIKGSIPRLDYCDVLHRNAPRNMVILVEGPIDARSMNQDTGLWSSYIGGKSIHPFIMSDILHDKGIERVLVWLDSEREAWNKAKFMAREIEGKTGVEAVPVYTGINGGDPASMDSSYKIDILSYVL